MTTTSPNQEGVEGTACEEVWMITGESVILFTYASFVRNPFILPHQEGIFLGWLARDYTSLRNSWVREIKQWCAIGLLPKMLQAVLDSIKMGTTIGDGLFYCLLNQTSRILLMQPKHLDKFFHASALRPLLTQPAQQEMVAGWPVLPPLPQGLGIITASHALFKQHEVVKRIKHILLLLKAAFMASQHPLVGKDLNMKRIGFQDQLASGLLDGHRVAIGFIGHLAVAIEGDLAGDTAVKRSVGQRTQGRLLPPPALPNGT